MLAFCTENVSQKRINYGNSTGCPLENFICHHRLSTNGQHSLHSMAYNWPPLVLLPFSLPLFKFLMDGNVYDFNLQNVVLCLLFFIFYLNKDSVKYNIILTSSAFLINLEVLSSTSGVREASTHSVSSSSSTPCLCVTATTSRYQCAPYLSTANQQKKKREKKLFMV